jgi:hypothetical protein
MDMRRGVALPSLCAEGWSCDHRLDRLIDLGQLVQLVRPQYLSDADARARCGSTPVTVTPPPCRVDCPRRRWSVWARLQKAARRDNGIRIVLFLVEDCTGAQQSGVGG